MPKKKKTTRLATALAEVKRLQAREQQLITSHTERSAEVAKLRDEVQRLKVVLADTGECIYRTSGSPLDLETIMTLATVHQPQTGPGYRQDTWTELRVSMGYDHDTQKPMPWLELAVMRRRA